MKKLYNIYTLIFVAIIYFIFMTLLMLFEHPLIDPIKDKMSDFLNMHEMIGNLFLVINVPLYIICCIYLFIGFLLLLNELLIFLKLDSRE